MSGEDPVLGVALLPNVVAGIQENVMAVSSSAHNVYAYLSESLTTAPAPITRL